MAKFIMSMGNEVFNVLTVEARNRDVSVQQLLRAVVVPDWIRDKLIAQASNNGNLHSTSPVMKSSPYKQNSNDVSQVLVSPAARLRR